VRIFIVSLLIITFNLIYSPGAFADYPDNSIIINIPSRTLDLYIGGVLRKSYPVGVGRPGFPTPIGHFKVENKVRNPGWEHPYKGKGAVRISPGGRSPLGTRWIAFKIDDGKNEYGKRCRRFILLRKAWHACYRYL
jgi:lipoprotein-anchoring transpeptidase ErfK/SrfK